MLRELRVGNLALVEELSLTLEPGLTMLTGETGAGKSLIAGALSLLTGVKADRGIIREGEDLAWVEGLFDLADEPELVSQLKSLGVRIDGDGVLVLRRELRGVGRGRVLINGLVSSLALLAQTGDALLAIQSQDQRRLLGRPSFAQDLLDDVLGLDAERSLVRERLQALRQLEEELSLRRQEHDFALQQLEMWEYQHRELQGMGLDPEEEAELAEQLSLGRNARSLLESAGRARELLTEGEGSAQQALGSAESVLAAVADRSRKVGAVLALLEEASGAVAEAGRQLERFLDGAVVDPARLDEMEERKAQYESLRRKYNRDVIGLLELQESLAGRIERQESAAGCLAELTAAAEEAQQALAAAALDLREKRLAGASDVAARACNVIRPLALPDLELEFVVVPRRSEGAGLMVGNENCEVGPTGADRVRLLARTNPGEKSGEVGEIASGGEQSRIYLGLSVLAGRRASQPLLLFDEIDAGLGMDKAVPVAVLLADLARQGQVLCITHLATVAARGQFHLRAAKTVVDGRTVLTVNPLDAAARLTEVTRLLGGAVQDGEESAAGRLTYAKQLLARA